MDLDLKKPFTTLGSRIGDLDLPRSSTPHSSPKWIKVDVRMLENPGLHSALKLNKSTIFPLFYVYVHNTTIRCRTHTIFHLRISVNGIITKGVGRQWSSSFRFNSITVEECGEGWVDPSDSSPEVLVHLSRRDRF